MYLVLRLSLWAPGVDTKASSNKYFQFLLKVIWKLSILYKFIFLRVLAASSWTCTYILAQEILEQLPLPGLFFVAIVEKPILVLSSLHPSNKISPACTTCFLNRFNTLPITNDTHQKLETKHKDICIHYYSVGINYSSKIKWLFFFKKKI